MTDAKKPLRLVDLEKPAGEIELPNGRVVAVRLIDGTGQQMRAALAGGTAKDELVWDYARHLLPDATEAEILSLSPTMIGVVSEIACNRLDLVLAYAASLDAEGKAGAPMPTAPSSNPETGSPTSS